MEIKQLTHSEFAETLNSADPATYQTIFENETWYEQVTIDEIIYRQKLLSLKKVSQELLAKKALEAKPAEEPIRLRAQNNGRVVALVFYSKTTLFYHLLASSKREIAQAKRMVHYYAKSILSKASANK